MSQATEPREADYTRSHVQPSQAADYARLYSGGYTALSWQLEERPLVRSVLASLADGRQRQPRLLDVATGSGRILQVADELGYRAVGADISLPMLALAHSGRPDARLVQADARALPFPPGLFDVVTLFRFVLNAQPALTREVLTGLRDHVRPGGAVVLNVHRNRSSAEGLVYRAVRRDAKVRSLQEVTEIIRSCGLRVEDVRWYGGFGRFCGRHTPSSERLLAVGGRLRPRWQQSFLVVARYA